ncbi:MAG: hypothetical protein JRJ20_06140, partial [Deltaproteobacteria bacterium]|nr:hypothetical protein [Deltaproteobacteria bacterium]
MNKSIQSVLIVALVLINTGIANAQCCPSGSWSRPNVYGETTTFVIEGLYATGPEARAARDILQGQHVTWHSTGPFFAGPAMCLDPVAMPSCCNEWSAFSVFEGPVDGYNYHHHFFLCPADLASEQSCIDGCPDDPDKTEPGVCGCGVPETDSDIDGVPDCIDNCPDDPNKAEPGQCGCGNPETDSDGDEVPDCNDGCPYDENKTEQYECETVVAKNQGGCIDCETCPMGGNPINFSTGNKYQKEADLALEGPGLPMAYIRYYNSQSDLNGPLGYGWTGSFSETLTFETGKIMLAQANGAEIHFVDDGQGAYISEADRVRVIVPVSGGYQLVEPYGTVLLFDSAGALTQISDRNGNSQVVGYADGRLNYVADNFGRRIDFAYDAEERLATLTTPIGQFTYAYDAQDNLANVTHPALTSKSYRYEDPNDPNNLTGIINENGIRSATYEYDDQDRAILSEGAGGRNRVDVSYDDNFVPHVTDSRGRSTDYTLLVDHGIGRVKSSTGEGCSSCPNTTGTQYDLNDRLWINSATDANGNVTDYTYDSRGNMLTKKEAAGTSHERTTAYTYHPDFNLITSITRQSTSNPGQTAVTSFSYDLNGNLLERTETGFSGTSPVSSTTSYTYNSHGRITQIDGPRTDVIDTTSFEYYPNDPVEGLNRGRLKKTTHSLGHENTFSQYNGFGKPEQVTDANNVVTTFGYDVLGRLTSNATAGVTTTSEYDAAGNLTAVYLPGGRTVSYTYTSADLLEKIEDNLGNHIIYSYDTEGNRIREEIHDSDGTLMRFSDHEFDAFNRLSKIIYPGNDIEERGYDLNGNLVTLTDENNNPTAYDYDALDRLISVSRPGNIITGYAYDSHDNLVKVTDAETNATEYAYDDLGRVMTVNSPDTGMTFHQYDPAGNLVSKTDAGGATVTYTYDALNRLTAILYPDSSQDITYTYDEGENGKGRLTTMADPSGLCAYAYDSLGNMVTETKTVEGRIYTTRYAYDLAGILTGITYPDGRTVTYDLDSAGRVSRVTTTKESHPRILADNISYLPLGPVTGFTYGNGTPSTKTYDQRYQVSSVTVGSIQNLDYSLDPVGNISGIADNFDASRSQAFGYDALYRLTSAAGIYGAIDYTYDNVGNRQTKTLNGQTETYTYIQNTNRIQETTGQDPVVFSYDANGNTTSMGNKTLIYNQNNRLVRVSENGAVLDNYVYNGNGQRVKKVSDGQTTLFIYDRDGNLISEIDGEGNILREFVYLKGERLALFAYDAPQAVEVNVTTSEGRTLSGINVYAFNEAGSYAGIHAKTDVQGVAAFAIEDFSAGVYRFRADYLSHQFWSPVLTIPGAYRADVVIEEEVVAVTVDVAGEVKEGVKVYLFNENGAYLVLFAETDMDGKVYFDLTVGKTFRFRADYMSSQYWSDPLLIGSGGTTDVPINTEGGVLTVALEKDVSEPLANIKMYLFSASGAYLGVCHTSDINGEVSYVVSGGEYKVRADYLGCRFWTDPIRVQNDISFVLTIPHQDVTVTVEGDDTVDLEPRETLKVYLFSPSGAYINQFQETNDQGQVVFNLPEKEFRVRADYLTQQYWSNDFNWNDEIITINEGVAELMVTNMGQPLEGVNVYVFNESNAYLNLRDITDNQGEVYFRLPEGEYNFRADYMGSRYFSGTSTLIPHVNNPINISTGGGAFMLTVLEDQGMPLEGVNAYLFNHEGTYLGVQGVTSGDGEAGFNVADGAYKIRIDYMGYQFWTATFTVPDDLTMTHLIPHQDVSVTIN